MVATGASITHEGAIVNSQSIKPVLRFLRVSEVQLEFLVKRKFRLIFCSYQSINEIVTSAEIQIDYAFLKTSATVISGGKIMKLHELLENNAATKLGDIEITF